MEPIVVTGGTGSSRKDHRALIARGQAASQTSSTSANGTKASAPSV
jgi:hypothetical protein